MSQERIELRICWLLWFSRPNKSRYVIVPYKFDAGVDDARKEVFRAAAAEWRLHTCVALVEDDDAVALEAFKSSTGNVVCQGGMFSYRETKPAPCNGNSVTRRHTASPA